MPLLSAQDRKVVQERFSSLSHDVTLQFFTQTIGAPEGVIVAKQILDEVVGLHDRLALKEINFVLDREEATRFGIEDVPAIAVLKDGQDTRMRFLGAPVGYEFMSLIEAIALAGSDGSGLSEESRALVAAHVTSPTTIKVFSTPT